MVCALVVALAYRIGVSGLAAEIWETAVKMRFAFLTVASVLALAYVMNFSGQTLTIGAWIAGTGTAFAFLGPVLGWIGIDPTLLVAATAVGLLGQESTTLRKVLPWSIGLLLVLCLLVGLQSTVLSWMLP